MKYFLAILFLLLTGCASTTNKGVWEAIADTEDSRLRMASSAYKMTSAEKSRDNSSYNEIARWNAGDQRVFVYYSFILGGYVFALGDDDVLESYISSWFDEGILGIGEYADIGSSKRYLEYQFFEHDGTPCVMFRHVWGSGRGTEAILSDGKISRPSTKRALGHDWMMGYSCDPGRQRFSEEDVFSLLSDFVIRTPDGLYTPDIAGMKTVAHELQ